MRSKLTWCLCQLAFVATHRSAGKRFSGDINGREEGINPAMPISKLSGSGAHLFLGHESTPLPAQPTPPPSTMDLPPPRQCPPYVLLPGCLLHHEQPDLSAPPSAQGDVVRRHTSRVESPTVSISSHCVSAHTSVLDMVHASLQSRACGPHAVCLDP